MIYILRGTAAVAGALAAILWVVPGAAAEWLPGPVPAEVTRVVDGDTI